MIKRPVHDGALLLTGLAGIAATAALLRLIGNVSPTTVALTLLLVVLAMATFGRLWIATTVAIAATVMFNYFFLPPIGTLAIAEVENLVALVTFLVVAVIASQLSATAQARARERIQLIEERQAAERVRQKADLAATLLASLSHDLKTPLTAIRVAVENLRPPGAADERREQADMAIVELDRLNRLFENILDMARIDADALNVARQWVTPADVVDAAAAHVRRALGDHRLVIHADDESDVEIDPRIASMALAQLLENASKYSPSRSAITVNATAESDGLHVTVADEGPGLDAGEIEHLFERFYRGPAARRVSPGSGLGLAITRGLLTAVGGHVRAENVSTGGARFTIVVPGARRPSPVASSANTGPR